MSLSFARVNPTYHRRSRSSASAAFSSLSSQPAATVFPPDVPPSRIKAGISFAVTPYFFETRILPLSVLFLSAYLRATMGNSSPFEAWIVITRMASVSSSA